MGARREQIDLNAFAQICALPPSTNSSMPVTKLESSEARNSAALAISSGEPMRPIGMVDRESTAKKSASPSEKRGGFREALLLPDVFQTVLSLRVRNEAVNCRAAGV